MIFSECMSGTKIEMTAPVGSSGGDRRLTIGELFAGMGGFGVAFKRRGFEVEWAIESDPFATATYRKTFTDTRVIEGRVEAVGVNKDNLPKVDVITAGFPCQPFSVAGEKKGLDDHRGRLFYEITRLLKEFGRNRPPIVILENVKGFIGHDRGQTFSQLRYELQKVGYWFNSENTCILNTSKHTTIPQNRERLFMVAFSTDIFAFNDFRFPDPVERREDVRSLLDLDSPALDRYYFDTANNRYGKMFEDTIEEGNPESIYLLRRSYIRENRNSESFTLTANMGDGGHNVPVIKDKWGIRKLTPTECARFQGIAEHEIIFPLEMSDAQKYKQIGNAVTIDLVEKLALECRVHLASAYQEK